jgi:hypothetical protein
MRLRERETGERRRTCKEERYYEVEDEAIME